MRLQILFAIAAMVVFAAGCDNSTNGVASGGGNQASGDHDHDHDHDHEGGEHYHPAHGPNGGHMVKIDSDEYTLEWCKFKDNNVIKMHVLDKDNKPVAVKVDSFKVIPMAGNDASPFELEAESPDADGKSSVYMLDDQSLSIAIPLGVNIEIAMGDAMIKGMIEQHEPLDH